MANYNFVLEVVGVIRASIIVSKKTFGKSLSFQIAKKNWLSQTIFYLLPKASIEDNILHRNLEQFANYPSNFYILSLSLLYICFRNPLFFLFFSASFHLHISRFCIFHRFCKCEKIEFGDKGLLKIVFFHSRL